MDSHDRNILLDISGTLAYLQGYLGGIDGTDTKAFKRLQKARYDLFGVVFPDEPKENWEPVVEERNASN
jgi:hypothetical protein